jgi:hypothetical protein
MAIPELLKISATRAVETYCAGRISPHARDQIRLEAVVRGDAITINERRPPWREDYGPAWTTNKIARLLYDPSSTTWTLWWADRNGRWLAYPPAPPATNVETLLAAIEADARGAFYG